MLIKAVTTSASQNNGKTFHLHWNHYKNTSILTYMDNMHSALVSHMKAKIVIHEVNKHCKELCNCNKPNGIFVSVKKGYCHTLQQTYYLLTLFPYQEGYRGTQGT